MLTDPNYTVPAVPPADTGVADGALAFHRLHQGERPLLLPNAWDFASAAALVDAGFPAIGTTSLGVAAAHGVPDGSPTRPSRRRWCAA